MSTTKLDWYENHYVAWLELTRPEAKNSISLEMLRSLRGKIREVKDSKARVLLITGSGDSFSAGADLKERKTMSDLQVKEFLSGITQCFLEIENLSIPTIAVINGFAFGGGLELALSCDIRYASESASMGLTETKLGIIPGAGGTQRLSRLVGKATAMEWIFSGKKIGANLAKDKGLVSDIFPVENLKESCLATAREISDSAPIAVKAAKRAIKEGLEMSLAASLLWERLCYMDTLGTKDRLEALDAFAQKRKPNFKGE
ncbi:enoyl-CoA hydratase-related protein [Leptospira sp. 96542]|nr:enoyl-CoA hydratase-related protein [Leptospira sp. 96542]